MAKLRSAGVVGVLVAAACLSGCGKEVRLTFINLTNESRDVHVTSPGADRQYLGVIPPLGKIRHTLRIEKKYLPATCRWTAGAHAESFRVTRQSDRRLWIGIRSPASAPPGGQGAVEYD